jgi:hypothetical protein
VTELWTDPGTREQQGPASIVPRYFPVVAPSAVVTAPPVRARSPVGSTMSSLRHTPAGPVREVSIITRRRVTVALGSSSLP